MGQLRDQLFLLHVNQALDNARRDLRKKHKEKKDNRFLIKQLTYEIGPCQLDGDIYVFEISSKIPDNLLFYRKKSEKYFKQVVKQVNKASKRPAFATMENIVYSSQGDENKERDYVNLTYRYHESELYSKEDIEKKFKHHQNKNIPLPEVPGVATPSGRIVILLVGAAIERLVKQSIRDLVEANDLVVKMFEKEPATSPRPKNRIQTEKMAVGRRIKQSTAPSESAKKTATKKTATKKTATKKTR